MTDTPPSPALPEVTADDTATYLRSLKPGERVIETGQSCMTGSVGTVYISDDELTRGTICVMWQWPASIAGMGTSATHGTRRIKDVLAAFVSPGIAAQLTIARSNLAAMDALLLHVEGERDAAVKAAAEWKAKADVERTAYDNLTQIINDRQDAAPTVARCPQCGKEVPNASSTAIALRYCPEHGGEPTELEAVPSVFGLPTGIQSEGPQRET